MYKSILLAIVLSLFTQNLTAQDVSLEKKKESVDFFVGFIFSPYAATTFNDDPIFTTGTALFFTTVVAKGDWSFAPYYNLSSNNVGAFVNYNISEKLGTYLVADKAIEGNTGNYILGFTTPVTADYIQAYIEVGSNYGDDPTPFLSLGLYFNVLKSIKRK